MTPEQKKRSEEALAALALLHRRGASKVNRAARQAALRASREGASLLEAERAVSGAVGGAVFEIRLAAAEARARSFSPGGEVALENPDAVAGPSIDEVADSLARQWADRVEAAMAAADEPLEEHALYGEAAQGVEAAAIRTGENEAQRAWLAEARAAYDADDRAGKGRIWISALEKNTCALCRGLHGTIALGDEPFPHGDPQLHVRCLCSWDPL